MKGKELKSYRENLELSQSKLSAISHIAQNSLSQYETGKRILDSYTEEHLLSHLRVVNVPQKIQLTNQLVRYITKCILEEGALEYWASDVKSYPEDEGDEILLNGGSILVCCSIKKSESIQADASFALTLENLFSGFKQWLTRSAAYVGEQVVTTDGEITEIDEIGINEICQYALFNDLLCDII